MLKSEVTEIHRVVTKMHAVHTLLLTGTPLQNNLHELWAVLRVLHPHIFDDPAPFDDCFDLTLRKVAHAHDVTLWDTGLSHPRRLSHPRHPVAAGKGA